MWTGRFSARHPLFAAAVVTVVCVTAADLGIGWACAAIGLAGLMGWFSGNGNRVWVWMICGALAVTIFWSRKETRALAEKELVGSGGNFTAELLADGRGIGNFWEAPAKLTDGPWKGTNVWWEGNGTPPVAGAEVTGGGNFVKLREPRNPEEFDEAGWLRRKGMVAVFRGQVTEVRTGKPAMLGAFIRSGFREAVTAGLEKDSRQAQVIRAIVIGEHPPDADELVAAFRNSGTLHIFSVSGMHVAMVGGIGWVVLRLFGVSRRKAVLAILPLVFGYAWISGNSPPAARSAWMMAVFLMAFVFRRQPDLLNSLGAVLLAAMLWDGNLLFQPGVQLSYGVVAAIGAGTAVASRWFAWIGRKDEYLPADLIKGWPALWLAFRRKLAAYFGVSAAAWIGSTPLTILHFGLVTPVAFFATGILGPLVFGLLSAALLSAAIHPVLPKASALVNRFNGMIADGCVVSAEWLSSLPGSHFETRSPGKPVLIVYDLDYGAGSACFSGGKQGAVLFDCADRQSFRHLVAPSLRKLGISPDSIIITHADGGHLGGAEEVWRAFPIRQVLLPVKKSRSPVYRRWQNLAPEAGIKVKQVSEVGSLPMPDGAWLEILHVPAQAAQNTQADERVAVYRLHWHGWKILFMSDAGIGIETEMLETGNDITADLVICGKNRGETSLSGEFLDAVKPMAIIASHSEFPSEERLDPAQVAYWKSRGISVIHQGQTGGVTVRVEDGRLILEGYVDRSVLRLARR